MSYEDFIRESGCVESIWKSSVETASWSGGVGVFVSVVKKDGKYEVRAEVEDKDSLNKHLANIDRGSWDNEAPTIQTAEDEGKALILAKEMLDDKDNWLSEKYN